MCGMDSWVDELLNPSEPSVRNDLYGLVKYMVPAVFKLHSHIFSKGVHFTSEKIKVTPFCMFNASSSLSTL